MLLDLDLPPVARHGDGTAEPRRDDRGGIHGFDGGVQVRQREVARPRQVAMYLSKQLTPRSLPEIGRRFGGRDHTTIMHGIRKIEELMGSDRQIAEDIDLLRRLLES